MTAKRVRNPITKELLPEGYDVDDLHVICPDGFVFPINERISEESWWREADAAAARDMAYLRKRIREGSKEEARKLLRKPVPRGYTHILADGLTPTLQAEPLPDGIDPAAIKADRATLPSQEETDTVTTEPATLPDVLP